MPQYDTAEHAVEHAVEHTMAEYSTTDLDEALRILSTAYAPVQVCRAPAGPSRFTASFRRAGPLAVERMSHSTAMQIQMDPIIDSVVVVHRLGGALDVATRSDPDTAAPDGPVLYPPHEGLLASWDDLRVGVIRLDLAILHQVAGQLIGERRGPVRFTGLSPVSADRARYWATLVRHVTRDVLAEPAIATSPIVVASAAHSVAAALLHCFPNTATGGPAVPSPAAAQPATLRRAVAFIDDNAHLAVTLGDVVDASGVTVRALQQAFRRHYGTTPTGYLRRVRLAHAHRALRAADPANGDTVAAIALRWGFVKASRFAELYRKVYGCAPRTTLHG
jgi:AraC-like DNA-binding protein